jgi:hypothetical protein
VGAAADACNVPAPSHSAHGQQRSTPYRRRPEPVIAAISSPTRAGTFVAVLIAAALLLALALSPRADARAHSAACTHSTSRTRHGAHSCAAGAGKGRRKGRTRTHSKTSAHRHPTGSHTPTNGGEQAEREQSEGEGSAGDQGTGAAGSGKAGTSGVAQARCEDTNAPEAIEGGENGSEEAFVCEDGSEPSCAGGLMPVVSSDGLQLLCEASPGQKHAS